jgi:serine/threonine protein kinase
MIGEILDAKYRIDKQLGAGGMGNVYLATHLGTTRVVAVKVIAPRWAAEPQFLARFQREAQACGRLRHPNIVNVTDFGIARSPKGDMPYLVMEFLDGRTLSDFQKDNALPPLPLIADLLDQIGLALAEAHRHGIVHRDLKPDNIWLEPNGRGGYTVKVLDFGVAKVNLLGEWAATPPRVQVAAATPPPLPADAMETVAISAARADEVETIAIARTPSGLSSGSWDLSASAHTMPGSLVGTPAYMSPEQALGKEIDFRSDIYSLAVVAYSLICGELPFAGKSNELIEYHQTASPQRPASLRKIPRDLADVLSAGLAPDPANRPGSALAFTRRIHNAIDAEFLALRRSKAFLMQHLAAFAMLMFPIYTIVLSITGVAAAFSRKVLPTAALRATLIPLAAAMLFVFSDNLLRASAALMALDEQVRIRRFLSFRVFWKQIRMLPVLVKTQAQSMFYFGPGWIVGDCLWPVVCVVEKLSGKAAVDRSRELMQGLRSAGRALAIRHLALAGLAIADVVQYIATLMRGDSFSDANIVVNAVWFPVFALFAGAPLFLYDRTAAHENGPLLQLDRTPEIRTTTRTFSTSSIIWLIVGLVYLLYQPIKVWLGAK